MQPAWRGKASWDRFVNGAAPRDASLGLREWRLGQLWLVCPATSRHSARELTGLLGRRTGLPASRPPRPPGLPGLGSHRQGGGGSQGAAGLLCGLRRNDCHSCRGFLSVFYSQAGRLGGWCAYNYFWKEEEGKLGREKNLLTAPFTPGINYLNASSVFFSASSFHLLPPLPSLFLPLPLSLSPRSLLPSLPLSPSHKHTTHVHVHAHNCELSSPRWLASPQAWRHGGTVGTWKPGNPSISSWTKGRGGLCLFISFSLRSYRSFLSR